MKHVKFGDATLDNLQLNEPSKLQDEFLQRICYIYAGWPSFVYQAVTCDVEKTLYLLFKVFERYFIKKHLVRKNGCNII